NSTHFHIPGVSSIVILLILICFLNLMWPGSPAQDFMYQFKGTCYFTNGTQRVRLMARQIYNKEEILCFDSDVGVFVAVTEQRMSSAKSWNAQKDLLAEYQAHTSSFTVQQRVEPIVTISPARKKPPQFADLLSDKYYPQQVKVRWFQNKEEETSGVVSTPLIQNGDWTYQILVMLEVIPQHGDVYTSHVAHPSLQSPITVEWCKGHFIDTRGSAERSKGREDTGSCGLGVLLSSAVGHIHTFSPTQPLVSFLSLESWRLVI
uniref:MHC class II beta chain N-terminal domain-containing protein n=1 Tax=Marmota marmota marmota TaxID=9994 RepID=A0A8C6AFW5_MARMA